MHRTISNQRSLIRQSMRQKRINLGMYERQQANAKIVTQLLNQPIFQCSQYIAGYLSTDGEVDIQQWFEQAWQQDKQCYLPVVIEKQLLFAHYTDRTLLMPNRWGILEPKTDRLLPPATLDLVIVPLVAFDTAGNRLGRGAGYYDRSFAFLNQSISDKKPQLIGIGYAFQQIPPLTPTTWDVPIQTVITEKDVFMTDSFK